MKTDRMSLRATEGSALALVLAILTVLTATFGAVMAVSLIQYRFVRRDVHRLQARYRAEGCLHEALARLAAEPSWREEGGAGEECPRSVRSFGGYLQVAVEARAGPETFGIDALVGFAPGDSLNFAVRLADPFAPLTLAGDTHLRGLVQVGAMGVETQVLDGRPFSGSVDGPIRRMATPALPAFDAAWAWDLRRSFQAMLEEGRGRSANPPRRVSAADSLRESVFVVVSGDLELVGPLVLPSGSRFVVGGSIRVTGAVAGDRALVYAGGSIRIEHEVTVAAQWFAEESIDVAGAELPYPTLLFVFGRTVDDERRGEIRLRGGAAVDGIALYPRDPIGHDADRGRLVVEEGAIVRGFAWSAHQAEIAGTVRGGVATRQFYFYASPTAYIDWLRDATIDAPARPGPFHLPLGFADASTPEVVAFRSWEK
jgi:hypothetical protein